MDFFDSLKQYLIFVLLCSTKILALLAARLAAQGFAEYLDPIRGGRCPLELPPRILTEATNRIKFFDSLKKGPTFRRSFS